MRPHKRWSAVLLLLPLFAGCDDEAPVAEKPARPVTFLQLKESDPARQTRLTGSVDSWKKEMLSFRVNGRISDVIEPGLTIEGAVLDDEGNTKETGTLLGRLDTDRLELQREDAAARVELMEARVAQAETELTQEVPEQIKEATAERDRRKSQFERQSKLMDQNATSRSEYEEAENWAKQSEAQLAQARIREATKTAELNALKAELRQARQTRNQAELNLKDCKLYSPFSGQVSKVHAIAGSYLDAGMPAVTVQMMDPVKVELAVSQETDRRLRYNDQLKVYLDNEDEPITGFVYLKDTVADAATRTFNITVLIRNRRVELQLPDDIDPEGLARTTELYSLESESADGNAPFYAEERTLHREADGRTYVWKVEGLTRSDLEKDFSPVFTVKKVYVELGEKTLPVLQLFVGRELTDLGGLDPSKDLIAGAMPEGVKDGDKVFLSRKEWLLRPGQLVSVDLKGQAVSPGFYVPRPAILRSDGKHFVFVAAESDSGSESAKKVEVEVSDLIGDFRRIEPVEENALETGSKIIVDGAHYLRDGDDVNAFEEIEVAL